MGRKIGLETRLVGADYIGMSPPPLQLARPLGKVVTGRWEKRGMVAPTHTGLQYSLEIYPSRLPEMHFDQMPRFRKWHALKAAFASDQVLNRQQLDVFFNVDGEDLEALWQREIVFAPVHGRDQLVRTVAYATEPQALDHLPSYLARRMALAEIRLSHPPPGEYVWKLCGPERYNDYRVDAICKFGDRTWAIVYDNGSYPLTRVIPRISALLEFGMFVRWIVPHSPTSEGQSARLNSRYNTIQTLVNKHLPQQATSQRIRVNESYVWCRHLSPGSKDRGIMQVHAL